MKWWLLVVLSVCAQEDRWVDDWPRRRVEESKEEVKKEVNHTAKYLAAQMGEPGSESMVPLRCCPLNVPFEGAARTLATLPKVLIGVVTKSGGEPAKLLKANIEALAPYHESISWAVALYDGHEGGSLAEVAEFAAKLKVKFHAFDGRDDPSVHCPFCPKLRFQMRFAEMLDGFEYLWLPDDDVSFLKMDWLRFWDDHDWARRPVISAPLVAPMTQFWKWFANEYQWKDCLTEDHKNATRYIDTTFIEMQAPLFDAEFFQFFASRMGPLSDLQQQLETSWGPDYFWCEAAAYWESPSADKERAPENSFASRNFQRTPCAIIFETVGHNDFKTTAKSKEYLLNGKSMAHLLHSISSKNDEDLANKFNISEFVLPDLTFDFYGQQPYLSKIRACVKSHSMSIKDEFVPPRRKTHLHNNQLPSNTLPMLHNTQKPPRSSTHFFSF